MAAGGMKFTQWLSGENICSPSRAALMTGRHAVRNGVYGNLTNAVPGTGDHRVFHPNAYGHLIDTEITVAERLRSEANYTTGMVGKW